MKRCLLFAFCGFTAALAAQQPLAPAFEVASVKPNKSGSAEFSESSVPGRFTAINLPLRDLISAAYGVPWFRMTGDPGWWFDRFDVAAKMPDGSDQNELGPMLRTLLTDRFKLKAHFETRQQDIFALTFARDDHSLGPQLRRSSVNCQEIMNAALVANPKLLGQNLEQLVCGSEVSPGYIKLVGVTIQRLTHLLPSMVGRIVVDHTGLSGTLDLDVRYAPNSISTSGSDVPTIFTALPEQLGLKLEGTKGPVDVLVIDSVERPTSN